jgi:hypothetical protein
LENNKKPKKKTSGDDIKEIKERIRKKRKEVVDVSNQSIPLPVCQQPIDIYIYAIGIQTILTEWRIVVHTAHII